MKKLVLLLALSAIYTFAHAQNAENICGTWLTQDGDSKVTISKNDAGHFEGSIVWLKTPKNENGELKKDHKNPEDQLKERPILGLKILEGFSYDADSEEWLNGTIYDPKSGNTYKCLMWFDGNKDVLYVKGYIGVSIIGRKVNWKRAV